MSQLTLKSSYKRSLKPLIESMIQNELRLLKMGIRRTEAKLKTYESNLSEEF